MDRLIIPHLLIQRTSCQLGSRAMNQVSSEDRTPYRNCLTLTGSLTYTKISACTAPRNSIQVVWSDTHTATRLRRYSLWPSHARCGQHKYYTSNTAPLSLSKITHISTLYRDIEVYFILGYHSLACQHIGASVGLRYEARTHCCRRI